VTQTGARLPSSFAHGNLGHRLELNCKEKKPVIEFFFQKEALVFRRYLLGRVNGRLPGSQIGILGIAVAVNQILRARIKKRRWDVGRG
jgi:hypothetical protein